MNLAYTCVKLLVRLYVCQRVFFVTHFGSIWVHSESILGPENSFWVHVGFILGFILGPFGIHLGSNLSDAIFNGSNLLSDDQNDQKKSPVQCQKFHRML